MTQEAEAVPDATTGSVRIDSGRNGSGAVMSRTTNAAHRSAARPSGARTEAEPQAWPCPPQVSAKRKAIAPATISPAPARSSRCRRSWRGRRRSALPVMYRARPPIGRLIQKMTDQCRCSAKTPPRTGPATLDVVNTAAM